MIKSKPTRRKCTICKVNTVANSMASVCSTECAIIKAQADRKKRERKDDAAKRLALRSRKWWIAKAKMALHAYIRARDENMPCISCDTILRKTGRPGGDFDAGHFRSVGSAKHLEFEEANIFGQCKHCNDYLASNHFEYERRLAIRCGQDYVDAIKADQMPRKLSIEDFAQIEITYKAKLKELTK